MKEVISSVTKWNESKRNGGEQKRTAKRAARLLPV
jgi:hypothetical protein